ncbi:flavodoxin I [Desulfuromusa kysingii]|uniref:Flavodoxin n=1 Tax=Desulfuromusa kysingii TaxID=37625 RepID=A0A1H3VTI5_9BACT|nr:flavodoxin [Desulfuromusa kysingii]SDZ78086.1 flavodoxin I [Desulfuromusa kysingii]
MKVGIFYGSTTGNTENVANEICGMISGSQVAPIDGAEKADLESCDLLFFGASTWGLGELQDDWADALTMLRSANLKGKKVALFGLGDQETYSGTFVDGIKDIHDAAVEAGATIVGKCSSDGYDFQSSEAFVDDQFLGLPLDEENQSEMTGERIKEWVGQVLEESK